MISSSDFVHFNSSGQHPRTRPYDGYLSFLTDPLYRGGNDAAIAHRCFAHDNLYGLELKDEIHEEASNIQVKPQEPCLWLVVALIGDCTIHAERASTVTSGNSVCFASNGRELILELNRGKNWLFVVGFGQPHFDALAEEFPFLESLKKLREGTSQHWIGEVLPVSSRLRARLESLRRFVFRPFSTPIQLAGWSLRLLNHFSRESKWHDVYPVETDDISHYHRAVKYIREHYKDDISLEKVADALHISVRNLTRSFENRPYSVNGYISHLRLTKARELLAFSDSPVRDIAYALRFSCPKHFSKTFKRKFNKSPMAYRDEMKGRTLGLDKNTFRR